MDSVGSYEPNRPGGFATGDAPDAAFDRLARIGTRTPGSPIVLVCLRCPNRLAVIGSAGLPGPFPSLRALSVADSPVTNASSDADTFWLSSESPILRALPELETAGATGCAVIPFFTSDRDVVGEYRAYYRESYKPDGEAIEMLRDIVSAVVSEIDLRIVRRESEQRKQRLEQEAQRLEAVLSALPIGVVLADRHGRLLRINDPAKRMWGGDAPYSHGIEGYGQYKAWWADTGKPIQPEEWAMARALRNGEVSVGELIDIERFDGTNGSILHFAAPIRDADGVIVGGIVTMMDVTEQRRTMEALRASEERLAHAQSEAHLGYVEVDYVTGRNTWSDETFRLFGYEPGEVEPSRENFLAHIHRDDVDQVLAVLRVIRDEGVVPPLLCRVMQSDGTVRWLQGRGRIIRDGGGVARRFVATFLDVTERKQAEDALQEARREAEQGLMRLTAVISSMGEGLVTADAEGNLLDWNPAALRLHGLESVEDTRENLVAAASQFSVSLPGGPPLPVEQWPLARVLRGDKLIDAEHEVRRLDTGQEWIISYSGAPVRGADGRVEMGVVTLRDVTAHRRAEVAMRRWADAFTHCAHGISIGQPSKNVIFACNPAYARLRQMEVDEIVGLPVLSQYDPATHDYVRTRLDEADRTGRTHFEALIRRKDGSVFPAQMDIVTVRDANGNLLYRVATMQDITERKRAEEALREINATLEQRVHERTAELEAANRELESFSYSVSHDLRAPLRAIDGFSQALLEDYFDTLDEAGREYLRRVRAGSQRMGQLIDDLLSLSRVTRASLVREPVDLSDIAHQVDAYLRNVHSERAAAVETRIAPGLHAWGDGRLLRIVLENLLGNAWKYTSRHPHARIEVGVAPGDGDAAIFVRDDGAGFDMAFADKLFGVFQRLHVQSEFEGNGVGLATVQRIIHRHGGRIWAEAAPERGATFYFTLPMTETKGSRRDS